MTLVLLIQTLAVRLMTLFKPVNKDIGPMKRSRFVLVGHCGPDMFLIKGAVSRALPDAKIEQVNDSASLGAHLSDDTVLLVNRVLDGSFGTDSGIELIRDLASADAAPVAILISNFADAQAEAVAAGARTGFGKSDLFDAETAEILRSAAGVE